MSLNLMSAYLEAHKSTILIPFSGSLTTTSRFIPGPGELTGEGYPIPVDGKLERLSVYDGSQVYHEVELLNIHQGDRIALYAQHNANYFIILVNVNGTNSALSISNIPENSNIFATVKITLKEE